MFVQKVRKPQTITLSCCCGAGFAPAKKPFVAEPLLFLNKSNLHTQNTLDFIRFELDFKSHFFCSALSSTTTKAVLKPAAAAPTTCSLLMAKELHFSMHFLQINFLPTTLT